jgi:hypothetical protein
MVNPLTAFTASTDKYGGMIHLTWTYPATLPARWKLFIFKKAGSNPTDQQITDFFAGDLTDDQLGDLGLFVFRDLDNRLPWIEDFRVLNGTAYYYRAVIAELTTGVVTGTSVILDAHTTPNIQFSVSTVHTKEIVIRAMEKIVDSIPAVNGIKTKLDKNIRVLANHSRKKDEDFFIVVSRTTGQNLIRFFNDMIDETTDVLVRGQIDVEAYQVEWICLGDPARRDHFSEVVRSLLIVAKHMIMRMGNGDISDVKFIVNGDSEGQYQGADAVKGSMTVAVTLETQFQIGKPEETYQIQTYFYSDQG